jgi:hypothetical protein
MNRMQNAKHTDKDQRAAKEILAYLSFDSPSEVINTLG